MASAFDQAMGRAAALFSAGELDEAARIASQIVAMEPRYFHGLHLLAVIAARRGDFAGCVDYATRALELMPANAEVLSNRGAALRRLDRIDEALADYERALALAPQRAESWLNRGVALAAANRHAEALAAYDQALALNPQQLTARFNRGLSRLAVGDLAGGWPDHEARWGGSDTQPPRRDFGRPTWTGGALAGKTLLVHAEQGLGDTIQFVRYVPQLQERGARVVLEVHAPLVELLRQSFPEAVVVARGEALPPFDLQCPFLSLPLAFGTTLASVPTHVPYLRVDDSRAQAWAERLGPGNRRRVGLAWSGNAALANDRNRSVALETLAPLLAAGCDFVSLQKELRESDRETLRALPSVRHFGDALADFRDTAALAAAMDLVISVDTAVAHLAGALARPAWILLPFAADWRWLVDREDSPWYPTVRLLRQPRRGDWEPVIARAARELAGLP